MSKIAIFGALMAFIIPIGLVIGIGASGTDLEAMLNGGSSDSGSVPTGKLYYFYAPM